MRRIINFVVRVYKRFFVTSNRKILWKILDRTDTLLQRQVTSAKELSAERKDLQELLRRLKEAGFTNEETTVLSHKLPKIKLSIIISVYNTEKYLAECLDSIVNQDLYPIEVLCVDDGSTDGSGKILDEYSDKYSFIRVFHRENQGPGAARNYGLNYANGEYVYFMDSDDRLKEDALSYLYNEAHSNELDILYFDGDVVFENAALEQEFIRYKTTLPFHRKREYNMVVDGQTLFCLMSKGGGYRVVVWLQITRRALLLENNIHFPERMYFEDNIFTLECLAWAKRASHRMFIAYYHAMRANSIMTSRLTGKHVYSSFLCYLKLINLITTLPLQSESCRYIKRQIDYFYNETLKRYEIVSKGMHDPKTIFPSDTIWELFQTVILR